MNIFSDKETAKLLENISIALLNSLNISFSAVDIITQKLNEAKYSELTEYMAMLRHSQYNLLYIAQNMSELGTSAADETPYNFTTVELNELCERLVNTISSLTGNTGVGIFFKKTKPDLTLTADYTKFERMLLYLISNSFLHCSQGNNIMLSADKNDDFITVTVSDNGTGISRQSMPMLFEDYLKDIEDYDSSKGVGLGISVAENIARMHGGTIVISSNSDSGAAATVSLPRNAVRVLSLKADSEYSNPNMHNVLTALSPILDYKKYTSPYI